jgi:hypothetical protein
VTFTFELAYAGSGYSVFEVKVAGKVVAVVLGTIDKDGEQWAETRILARGYEEREVSDAFAKTHLRVG